MSYVSDMFGITGIMAVIWGIVGSVIVCVVACAVSRREGAPEDAAGANMLFSVLVLFICVVGHSWTKPRIVPAVYTAGGAVLYKGQLLKPEWFEESVEQGYKPGLYKAAGKLYRAVPAVDENILVVDTTEDLKIVFLNEIVNYGQENHNSIKNTKPVLHEVGARDNVLRGTNVKWSTAMWRYDPNTWEKDSGPENGRLVLIQYK